MSTLWCISEQSISAITIRDKTEVLDSIAAVAIQTIYAYDMLSNRYNLLLPVLCSITGPINYFLLILVCHF